MDTKTPVESVIDLSPRCRLWYIDLIRELLSESNMCIVRESCLGHLFDIGDIQFQDEVMKLLCRRLHSSSLGKNSLAFNFADYTVVFGGADFCLMTGLKYSGDTSLPKQSTFHDLVFRSRNTLIFADLEHEFRKECAINHNSVTSLKLAYMILIYGLLVFNNPDTGRLDLGYLHMMDDLELFNDFPWGFVAYNCLVSSTHRLKRELSSVVRDRQSESIIAYGFVYALQCWAYEVSPLLGTFCATLNIRHLRSFPRILKWIVTRNLSSEDDGVRKFFLAEHGYAPVPIQLSPSEMKKLEDLGINPSMRLASPTPFINIKKNVWRKLDFGSSKGHQSNSKKQTSNRKASPLGSSPRRSRKRKSESSMPNGTPRSGSLSNTKLVTPEGSPVVLDHTLNEVRLLVLSVKGEITRLEEYMETKFKYLENLIDIYSNRVACSCSTKLGGPTPDRIVANSAKDGRDLTKRSTSKEYGSAASGHVRREHTRMKSKLVVSSFENIGGVSTYDPNESNMMAADLDPFIGWMFDPLNKKRENELMLPTDVLQYGGVAWFKTLWSDDGWLDNTHIDALINLLIIRYDKNATFSHGRRWSCLEICCWQALTKANLDEHMSVLMPYICGERPVRGGVKWCEVDHLFGVANVHGNHWIFYDVSLEEQKITIYNSLEQEQYWDSIVSHFSYVRRNLPILCSMGGLWDSSTHNRSALKNYWDVMNHSGTPKQVNTSDCGIMAIKFMECLAYNVSVTKIIPRLCEKFRQGYCAKLFQLAEELKQSVGD